MFVEVLSKIANLKILMRKSLTAEVDAMKMLPPDWRDSRVAKGIRL